MKGQEPLAVLKYLRRVPTSCVYATANEAGLKSQSAPAYGHD